MTYVIIGAGPSGVTAAETLRKVDPEAEIILIGGEPEPPYSRMAIPYLLTGLIEEAGTYLRKRDGYYDANRIAYRKAMVESIDTTSKSIRLSDGNVQSYDKLLIATGASPVNPPIKGLDLPGVHHCWTLPDARRIIEKARAGADVVLMGAGFIGCIILESLVERGVNLTVVEAEDRMVPRMMDEPAGAMIGDWCVGRGVKVLTSTMVTEISEKGDRRSVSFDNGDETDADLVVVATGVSSNIRFLEGSGVKTDSGILVDNHMRSSVEDVFAAGDCAQGLDFSTGGWEVHAIQPTAVEHARNAALNMAGRPTPYFGSLNMNILDTAGLVSVSCGLWDGVNGGDHAESMDKEDFRYIRLEFEGDRIVGALSLGRTDHIGVLRGLIQTRLPLGAWKGKLMADPNRIVEAYIDRTLPL